MSKDKCRSSFCPLRFSCSFICSIIVAIIGENEMKQGLITVKDLRNGEQKAVKQDELLHAIQ